MRPSFTHYHPNPIGYLSTPAPMASETVGPSRKRPKFRPTCPGSRRLAARCESPRRGPNGLLSSLRKGNKLKILRKSIGRLVGGLGLLGKSNLARQELAQVKQVRRKGEILAGQLLLKQQNLLQDRRWALGSLVSVLDPLVQQADVGSGTQRERVLDQQIGGRALRDLCMGDISHSKRIADLDVDDLGFEAAKVRGLEFALSAGTKGMGGKDFLLDSLNRIGCLKSLIPGTRSKIAPQELEALRSAVTSQTVTYEWVDSLVNSAKDLQALLDVALE